MRKKDLENKDYTIHYSAWRKLFDSMNYFVALFHFTPNLMKYTLGLFVFYDGLAPFIVFSFLYIIYDIILNKFPRQNLNTEFFNWT